MGNFITGFLIGGAIFWSYATNSFGVADKSKELLTRGQAFVQEQIGR